MHENMYAYTIIIISSQRIIKKKKTFQKGLFILQRRGLNKGF